MLDAHSLEALIGGALIGAAAVFLMLVLGRVAGVSGIVAGLLPPLDVAQLPWRAAFVAGLLVAPFVYRALYAPVLPIEISASLPLLVVGGLCVGVGTVLGSGCTSGHGVCGLARLSVRSFVAVPAFMAAAGVTVFVSRHLLGGGV